MVHWLILLVCLPYGPGLHWYWGWSFAKQQFCLLITLVSVAVSSEALLSWHLRWPGFTPLQPGFDTRTGPGPYMWNFHQLLAIRRWLYKQYSLLTELLECCYQLQVAKSFLWLEWFRFLVHNGRWNIEFLSRKKVNWSKFLKCNWSEALNADIFTSPCDVGFTLRTTVCVSSGMSMVTTVYRLLLSCAEFTPHTLIGVVIENLISLPRLSWSSHSIGFRLLVHTAITRSPSVALM